ncbi:DeoR family transcriptional regulator [Acidiphilium sp. AL]|uniref:DeoR family transcriptional regulator n=1 Tax=Acidiphilium iwatense TaxID=768198 RepID=A0ABS9E1E3_9PROT|nr:MULTISPECIES: DeoR family transcriptional regulator [Acidiphilium]MCF3947860.1 DeoR family transcriptional regulator [Acidiphilium iwatense]MCU4160045.1 DeoR family transcriptional regulator [Acidiphilium sp. AL]
MSDRSANATRLTEIVALVGSRGFQTIDSLAQHFDVTVQTIRRDLNALAAEGKISRYRGGAGLPSSIENMEYERRKVVHLAAKQRIAAMAACDVPDHASLFINIGSTTEQVARALLDHTHLRIITNNLNVARIMSENPDFRIVVTGGTVRNRDGGITGQATRDMLDQFRADLGIIGISGIDADGGLYDYDMDEVICSQAIIRNARRVLLVTDHSKFGRPALMRVGNLAQIAALYTDLPPPAPIAALIASLGVELHIAPEGEDGATARHPA